MPYTRKCQYWGWHLAAIGNNFCLNRIACISIPTSWRLFVC